MASMSPRTPTTSPSIGILYNAAIAYNAPITYNQATTAGGAFSRTVARATASARQRQTSTMKPR
jgi:hypothetical protein